MKSYRGSDNPKARKPVMTVHPCRLVPRAELPIERRPPLLPGRKSRRERRNVWVRT